MGRLRAAVSDSAVRIHHAIVKIKIELPVPAGVRGGSLLAAYVSHAFMLEKGGGGSGHMTDSRGELVRQLWQNDRRWE